jgi:hypothetical protein
VIAASHQAMTGSLHTAFAVIAVLTAAASPPRLVKSPAGHS